MKTRIRLTKPLALTMTMALLAAACLLSGADWLQPVAAQNGDGNVQLVSYQSIGIVSGEKVRLSVGNTARSAGNLTLSFSYYLAHGTNAATRNPVYQSEWMQVAPGEMRFSDLSRRDLHVAGEPITGRTQLLVKATVIGPAGTNPAHLPGGLEVINEVTGATTVLNANRIWEYTPCCDPSY